MTAEEAAETPGAGPEAPRGTGFVGVRPFDVEHDTAARALRREVVLGAEVAAALSGDVPGRLRLGPDELLLAALAVAVNAAVTGDEGETLTIDREVHGHDEHQDLSRTVGWLTRLIACAVDVAGLETSSVLGGGPACEDLARRVRAASRAGHADHDGGPAPACLNYLGRLGFSDEDWGLTAVPAPVPPGDTRLLHPLTLDVFIEDRPDETVLRAHWTAAASVGDEALDRLVTTWSDAVTALLGYARALDHPVSPSAADLDLVDLDEKHLSELVGRYGPVQDVLPLTPLQNGLLFHSVYDDGDDVYAVQFAFDLTGDLDASALTDALERVVSEIPNLGAAFLHTPRPVQILPERVRVPVAVHDLRGLDAAQRDDRVAELLLADRTRRFDLADPPLIRALLLQTGERSWTFSLTNHHILVDGWSMPLLAERIFAAYAGRSSSRVRHCRDHLALLSRRSAREGLDAWHDLLGDLQEPSLLCPGVAVESLPQRLEARLDGTTTARLTRAATDHGLTLNSLVQGAWGAVLSGVLGRRDVVFGTTVSGRPAELAGMESMVGLFINTVPVRWEWTPGERLDEVLGTHQARQHDLVAHHHVGLADIQREVGIGDLFDTLFVFENYPLDASRLHLDGTGVTVDDIRGVDATHYPVTVVVTPGERLHIRVDHREPACGPDLAAGLLDRFVRVLTAFAESLDRTVAEIDVLPDDERERVLHHENDTAVDVPDTTLPALVSAQAARTPQALALVADDHRWTYAEFDAVTNRWARALVERGVGPGQVVGLAMPRCADLVLAMHAIEKAGGAYLPMDPEHPADRLAYMVENGAPRLVLTRSDVALPDLAIETVTVQDLGPADAPTDDPAAAPVTDADRLEPLRPEHPAYVIYTSGSTGRPKGVAVSHRAIVNRLVWMQDRYGLGEDDRVMQKTPASFDVSVWEFFWPFQVGAALVVARPDGHRDPRYLNELVEEQRITTIHFVPSMLAAFLDAVPPPFGPSLRRVFCSGEALPADLAHRLLASCNAELHNLYGPTEAAVDVTSWACNPSDRSIPIGHPVWNTRMYVLDDALRPCGIGVPGDLYIAGRQLALGYVSRPGLTAERFVADPYGPPGSRMYRTGDIARRRGDGALMYLGRSDHQVKIRGLRIELGEIEATLSSHPDVAGCAVIATPPSAPGGARLVAYLAGEGIDSEAVRAFAGESLPEYMVPADLVTLPELPLTSNGKLDRKALPDPPAPVSVGGRSPSDPTEAVLAQVFADVLGVGQVGADDSFFALGGDSITSIQVVTRARTEGLEITPRQVFEHRTVAALARVVGTAADATEDPDAGIGPIALTPFGRWIHEAGGDVADFHQAVSVVTPAHLRQETLDAALTRLVDHHDALRMRTAGSGEDVTAEILPRASVTVRLDRVETDGCDDSALDEVVAARAADLPGLAPDDGDLLRATWFDRSQQEGRLLLRIHHLAVDAVSWEIIMSDLEALCEGGEPPGVRTSYRTWCRLMTEEAQGRHAELPRWAAAVAGPRPPVTRAVLDPQRDLAPTAETVEIELPAAVGDEVLGTLGEAFNVTVEHVLLSALAVAAGRLWPADSLLVDVEGHGRTPVDGTDVTRTVGWFTTVRPVRLQTPGAREPLGDVVRSVKESLRSMPDEGRGYGLLRWCDPDGRAELGRVEPARVGFNYLGVLDTTVGERPWRPSGALSGGGGAGMRLLHEIEIVAWLERAADGSRLRARLIHPQAVAERSDMEALGAAWGEALLALAALAQDPDAGGMTPSDVSLVDITQDDLDAFEDDRSSEWEML